MVKCSILFAAFMNWTAAAIVGYQSVRAQQILILNKGLSLLISALSVSYGHMVCCRGHHDSSCSYAITMFDAWLDNLLHVQQKCGKDFPVNRVCTVSVTNRESHTQLRTQIGVRNGERFNELPLSKSKAINV